jgi:hypothetical protein
MKPSKIFLFTLILVCLIAACSKKKSDPTPTTNTNNNNPITFPSNMVAAWYTQEYSAGSPTYTSATPMSGGNNAAVYFSKDSLQTNYNGVASGYPRQKTFVCDEPSGGLQLKVTSAGKYYYRVEYGTINPGYIVVARGVINVASDGTMTLSTQYPVDPAWSVTIQKCASNNYSFTIAFNPPQPLSTPVTLKLFANNVPSGGAVQMSFTADSTSPSYLTPSPSGYYTACTGGTSKQITYAGTYYYKAQYKANGTSSFLTIDSGILTISSTGIVTYQDNHINAHWNTTVVGWTCGSGNLNEVTISYN